MMHLLRVRQLKVIRSRRWQENLLKNKPPSVVTDAEERYCGRHSGVREVSNETAARGLNHCKSIGERTRASSNPVERTLFDVGRWDVGTLDCRCSDVGFWNLDVGRQTSNV